MKFLFLTTLLIAAIYSAPLAHANEDAGEYEDSENRELSNQPNAGGRALPLGIPNTPPGGKSLPLGIPAGPIKPSGGIPGGPPGGL